MFLREAGPGSVIEQTIARHLLEAFSQVCVCGGGTGSRCQAVPYTPSRGGPWGSSHKAELEAVLSETRGAHQYLHRVDLGK